MSCNSSHMAVLPVNKRERLTDSIELTVCGDKVGHRSGMIDASIPSLLRLDERREPRVMNGSALLTFPQLPGRALGCCCLRSNGLRPHCQQYHLTIIARESLLLVHTMAWATYLQRQCNRRHMLGVERPGCRSLRRFG